MSFIRKKRFKAQPIEYRPHAQHKAHQLEDLFDVQYSCYLWCQSLIDITKGNIFSRISNPILQDIAKVIEQEYQSIVPKNLKTLIFLKTELSDLDREYSFNRIMHGIGSHFQSRECFFTLTLSSFNIETIQIAFETLIIQFIQLLKSHANSSLREIGNSVSINDIHVDPIDVLGRLFDRVNICYCEQTSLSVFYIFAFPFIERMPSNFLVLLTTFFRNRTWNAIILLSCSDLAAPRMLWEDACQTTYQVHYHQLFSPSELYERFTLELLATNKLPVHFSYDLIRYLHQQFVEETMCISTFILRLLDCINFHFRKRKSILCMYREVPWLKLMRLANSRASAIKAFDDSSIHEIIDIPSNAIANGLSSLLAYLEGPDVQDTALLLSRSTDVRREGEIKKTNEVFSSYWSFRFIAKVIFQCLQVIKESLFVRSNLSSAFHSSLLFSCLLETQPISSYPPQHILSQFIKIFDKVIKITPEKILSLLTRDLVHIVKSQSNSQSLHADHDKFLKAFASSLEDISSSFEALEDLIGSENSEVFAFSYEKMQLIINNPNGQESVPEISSNRNILAQTTSIDIIEDIEEETVIDIPSNIPQDPNDGIRNIVTLDSIDIYGEILNDFSSWLHSQIKNFASLDRFSMGLEGILFTAESVKHHLNHHIYVDIRQSFVQGLAFPAKFLPKGMKLIPDVTRLADRVRFAQPKEVVTGWVETFIDSLNESKDNLEAESSSNSKRRKVDREISQQTASGAIDSNITMQDMLSKPNLRCRFAHAIHDIEKSGILSSKYTDQQGVIIMKQIYTGIQ